MREITPISQLGNRMAEHGKIRLGVKTERAMKSIDTFRFTSPDAQAIVDLAALYGGTPKKWSDPKQAVKNQWEVISTSTEIHIFLPPNAISIWYECWSEGGLLRQCDGETANVPTEDGMEETECICFMKNKMECKRQTRMIMILPEIKLGGVWRLDTKGINASEELPAMEAIINQIQTNGNILDATLRLEQRKKVRLGKTKNFVVPVLGLRSSPLALLGGEGQIVSRPSLHVAGTSALEAVAPPLALVPPPIETVEDAIDPEPAYEDLVARNSGLGLDVGGMERAVLATAAQKKVSPAELVTFLLSGDVQIVTVNNEGILRLRARK